MLLGRHRRCPTAPKGEHDGGQQQPLLALCLCPCAAVSCLDCRRTRTRCPAQTMTVSQFSAIECACPECVSMCQLSTCLPTPDEARSLISAGFASRLARYEWNEPVPHVIGPAPAGMEGRTLQSTRLGPCTFLRDNRCELHPLGLKPYEGRIAHHTRSWVAVRTVVLRRWNGMRYKSVLAALDKAVSKESRENRGASV